MKQRARAAKGC